MNSIGNNVFLSSIANISNQAIRAIQQLIWIPLFLFYFGKDLYGEWLTLYGLAGYVLMSSLGVHLYWLNLLTGAYIREEIENYKKIFRAGLFLFSCIFVLSFILSIVFAIFNGPSRVLDLKEIPSSSASIVFVILVVSILALVMSGMIRGVFRTAGRNPRVVWYEVALEFITLLIVSCLLIVGVGPLGLACGYFVISVLLLVWVTLDVRRNFPNITDFSIGWSDLHTSINLIKSGSIYMAGILSDLLLIQGVLIITKWELGSSTVALVATSRSISNAVRLIAASINRSTLPEFSRLEAINDLSSMAILLRRSTTFILLISGMACISLIGAGPWFFFKWTGGRFPDAAPLIYLFGASVLIDAIRLPLHDFLLGCNRIALVSISDVFYALLSLMLTWILFDSFGVWSVPIATIISGIFIQLPILYFETNKVFNGRAHIKSWSILLTNIPMILLIIILILFIQSYRISVIANISLTAIAALIYGLMSWLISFTTNDRLALKNVCAKQCTRIMQSIR